MSHQLRKQTAASVPNPKPGRMQFFVDTDGAPKLKDSAGAVTAAAAAGNPVPLNEQGSDPGSIPNVVQLYSKEVLGVTEFFVIDSLGQETQITNNGTLNSTPGVNVFLNNPQEVEIVVNYTGAGTDEDYPTGIIIPDLSALTNNAFTLRIYVQGSADGAGSDIGYVEYLIGWGTSPGAHPMSAATFASIIITQNNSSAFVEFEEVLTEISTLGTGELILTFNSTGASNVDYFGTLKILMSPVKQFPFQPMPEPA